MRFAVSSEQQIYTVYIDELDKEVEKLGKISNQQDWEIVEAIKLGYSQHLARVLFLLKEWHPEQKWLQEKLHKWRRLERICHTTTKTWIIFVVLVIIVLLNSFLRNIFVLVLLFSFIVLFCVSEQAEITVGNLETKLSAIDEKILRELSR
jgi:uncharacterized membrane protein YbaN (DUF454 family)